MPARGIEILRFLHNTLYRNPLQSSNFSGTFDQLSYKFFTGVLHKMPLYFFYTMVEKSQNWQTFERKN